jgi:two-component system sensor histidine kinase SenX3
MALQQMSEPAMKMVDGRSLPPGGPARHEWLMLASHELVTPLASLKLQVQAVKVKSERDPAATPEWIAGMLAVFDRQVGRLENLVDDLLLATRIQSGSVSPAREDVDIGALVTEIASSAAAQYQVARGRISVNVEEGLVGHWDCALLARAVFHLIKNAITFDDHGSIEIEVRGVAGQCAQLTVRDHGVGIEKKDQERIFAYLERAVPVERFGGLGLGLYLAGTIVQMHGGTIKVDSELGRGATFTVGLPVGGGSIA